MSAGRWAILIIDADGATRYVVEGPDPEGPIKRMAKREAKRWAEFWREGIGEDVQSVNVVPAPRPAK